MSPIWIEAAKLATFLSLEREDFYQDFGLFSMIEPLSVLFGSEFNVPFTLVAWMTCFVCMHDMFAIAHAPLISINSTGSRA